MARASKLIARYTPEAERHNERCELCRHFEAPNSCNRVVGYINRKGWCKFFERKANEQ